MQACDVIAQFADTGKVIPLKIRISEGGEYRVVIIKTCLELTQAQRKSIKRYRCKVVINDILREYELIFFFKDSLKWVLAGIK